MTIAERRAARRAARAQRKADRQAAVNNRRNTRQEQRTARSGARAKAREVAYQSGIDPRAFIGDTITATGKAFSDVAGSVANPADERGLFDGEKGEKTITGEVDNTGMIIIAAGVVLYMYFKK